VHVEEQARGSERWLGRAPVAAIVPRLRDGEEAALCLVRPLRRRFLLTLSEGEALRLFAACLAFLNVVSALAVSHKF
jgi:hypothetical protein